MTDQTRFLVRKIDGGAVSYYAGHTLFGRCWSGREEAVEMSRDRAEDIALGSRIRGEYTPADRVVEIVAAVEEER